MTCFKELCFPFKEPRLCTNTYLFILFQLAEREGLAEFNKKCIGLESLALMEGFTRPRAIVESEVKRLKLHNKAAFS